MKKPFLLTITFILTITCVLGQTDKKTIFIQGHIYSLPRGKDSFIPYVNVAIKGTKIYTRADSLGFYSINITEIADTINKITLYCAYPGYFTKELFLKHKITKTTELDFELTRQPACELPDIGDGKKNKNMRTRKQK